MSVLALWSRRGSARFAAPAMLGIALVLLFARDGWDWEWQRAVSWSASSTIVLGPVLAGLVAFDLWRYLPDGVVAVVVTSPRGRIAALAPAVPLCGAAVLAAGGSMTVAAVRTAGHAVDGAPSWWDVGRTLVALLAYAAFGAAVGLTLRNVAAAPAAAVAAYLLPIGASIVGVPGLLTAGGATGSTIGIRPTTEVAALSTAVDALVCVVCLAVALGRAGPRRVGLRVGVVASGLALAATATVLSGTNPAVHGFEQAPGDAICVLGAIRVCGPGGGKAVYAQAQRDLEAAWRQVPDLGAVPPDGYVYSVGTDRVPPGTGQLSVATENITPEGHLDPWDLAATMSRPTVCEAFSDDQPPMQLLDAAGRLSEWLVQRFAQGEDGEPVPEVARQTYAALADCDASELPDWPRDP